MANDNPSSSSSGGSDPSNSKIQATHRLTQLSSHISAKNSSNSPTSNKKSKKSASTLPADYSDVLGQLATLRTLAATPDLQNRGYIRQKQAGKLWVRERIDLLLDPGTFSEIGSVSGTVTWRQTGPLTETPVAFTPSNNLQGLGKLWGRTIVFTADDFSIRGGHADGATTEKTMYVEKMAIAMKLPIVKLVDGSSGGGSVTTIKKEGWSYVPQVSTFRPMVEQLNSGVPNLGAVLGPAVSFRFFLKFVPCQYVCTLI